MQIAPRPRAMPRSGIREIGELAASRPGTIRLEIGEPDSDTPLHVTRAAHNAASRGETHYAPNAGIFPLREALADKVSRVNAISADAADIVVTHGAVEGLFSVLAAIVTHGDDVLVPDPGWPNYRMMATLLGAESVGYPVDTRTGQIDVAALEAIVTPRTQAIIVNTPSNPLGTVLSEATLRTLYDFAERHDLWVISDEVYDQLVSGRPVSAGALEAAPERVVSVFSFSKTYAMTGWRVGYVVAPPQLVSTLTKIQEPVISCAGTPAQYAALAAVSGPQEVVAHSVTRYARRAQLATALLLQQSVRFTMPHGAFYLWVDVGPRDGSAVAHELVSRHGVAVAPGPTFGSAGRSAVRIALSASDDNLTEGITRMLDSGLLIDSGADPSLSEPRSRHV